MDPLRMRKFQELFILEETLTRVSRICQSTIEEIVKD